MDSRRLRLAFALSFSARGTPEVVPLLLPIRDTAAFLGHCLALKGRLGLVAFYGADLLHIMNFITNLLSL